MRAKCLTCKAWMRVLIFQNHLHFPPYSLGDVGLQMTKPRILIAEDEGLVALGIETQLQQFGYVVSAIVASGKAAIAAASEGQPDLILMDIRLPGEIDGIQAADIIRKQYNIPIVYLTAYSDGPTIERAKLTEPYGYLLKPFEPRELLSVIEIVLYKHEKAEALKERERWLSTTLRSIADGVITTDSRGRVTFMNAKAEAMTGRQQADVLGLELAPLLVLSDSKTGRPEIDLVTIALETNQNTTLRDSACLDSPTLGRIAIEDQATLLRDDDSKISGVVLIFRDISLRKQAELQQQQAHAEVQRLNQTLEQRVKERTAELEQRTAELEATLHSFPDLLFRFAADGTYLDFNTATMADLYCEPAEFLHKPVQTVLPAPVGDRFYRAIQDSLRTQSPTKFEYQLTIRDQELCYETHLVPIGQDQVVAVARNITERVAAARNLHESRERYRTLFQTCPIGLSVTNAQGKLIEANPAARKILHLTDRLDQWPILGYEGWQLFVADDTPLAPEDFATYQAFQKKQLVELQEVKLQRPDGSSVWLSVMASPMPLDGYDILTAYIDITQRHRAEEETSHALARERELNELKSRFIAMASHEFRTPLGIVLNSTELLEEYGDKWSKTEKAEHFQRIKNNILQITALLEDVLTSGQAEAGQLRFSPEKVDLVTLVKKIAQDVQANHGYEQTIVFQPQMESLITYLDPLRIRQALENLLTNALKYSAPKTEVDLKLYQTGTQAILQICDRGIGIPIGDQKHLFQPFYRGSNTGRVSGTGLGLAIVQQCIALHSGDIELESTPGQGTTVTIRLPLISTLSRALRHS